MADKKRFPGKRITDFYAEVEGGTIIIKGIINIPADFPLPTEVQVGWTYFICTDVIDNDPTRTNTGQSFLVGQEIVWTEANLWGILGDNALWLDDSINLKPLTTSRIVQGGAEPIVAKDLTTKLYVDTGVAETDIIHLRENGNDTKSGLNIANALAHVENANNLAISKSPDANNRIVIKCIDDGLYYFPVPVQLGDYIDLDMRNARIIGSLAVSPESGHNVHIKNLQGTLSLYGQNVDKTAEIGEKLVNTLDGNIIAAGGHVEIKVGEVFNDGIGYDLFALPAIAAEDKGTNAYINVGVRWKGNKIELQAATGFEPTNVTINVTGNFESIITANDNTNIKIVCWERVGNIANDVITGSGTINIVELKSASCIASEIKITAWIGGDGMIIDPLDSQKYIIKENTFIFKNYDSPYDIKTVILPEQLPRKPNNIETANVTYIYVDVNKNIIELNAVPTVDIQEFYNKNVSVGFVRHDDHSTPPTQISEVKSLSLLNGITYQSDLINWSQEIGEINKLQDVLSPNGANLHLNRAVLSFIFPSAINFDIDSYNSGRLSVPPELNFFMFRVGFFNNDPNLFFFDVAQDVFLKKGSPIPYGVYNDITAANPTDALKEAPSEKPYFILRFFYLPQTNPPNIVMQYGQVIYANLTSAENAYLSNTDAFIENAFTTKFPHIGTLITRRGATNLAADLIAGLCKFYPGSKLKGIAGGAGARAQAYIPPPESNLYYVGKHGNDFIVSGKNLALAFLTPQKGLTEATAQTPTENNQFGVKINDSGVYDTNGNLDFTSEYLHLNAANASLFLTNFIKMKQNTSLIFERINIETTPTLTRGIIREVGSGAGASFVKGNVYNAASINGRSFEILEGFMHSAIESVNASIAESFVSIRNGAVFKHSGKDVSGAINIYDTQGKVFINLTGNYTGNINIGNTNNSFIYLNIGGEFNGNITTSATISGSLVVVKCGKRTGGIDSGLATIKIYNYDNLTLPDGSKAITQSTGDNSTKVATTAYVDSLQPTHNALAGLQGGLVDEYYHSKSAEYDAITNANSPSISNVFATIADIGGIDSARSNSSNPTSINYYSGMDILADGQTTLTLSNVPSNTKTLHLYRNGILQDEGINFTISSAIISWIDAIALKKNIDIIQAIYYSD